MCEKPCKNYFTHLQCSQLWEIICSWAKIALPCGEQYPLIFDSLLQTSLSAGPTFQTSHEISQDMCPHISLCLLPCHSSISVLSCVWLFVTLWTKARQSSLSIINSRTLLKLNVHWVSGAIQPSNLLSSPSLPAFSLSQNHSIFQWISSSHEVEKV